MKEAPKLHAYVLLPVALAVHQHRHPRLDVPGKRWHDHVGPVADQVVERTHMALTPFSNCSMTFTWSQRSLAGHYFGRTQVPARGDVDEVADVVV